MAMTRSGPLIFAKVNYGLPMFHARLGVLILGSCDGSFLPMPLSGAHSGADIIQSHLTPTLKSTSKSEAFLQFINRCRLLFSQYDFLDELPHSNSRCPIAQHL